MNLLEKLGWSSGFIVSVIAIITFITGELDLIVRGLLGIGALTILAITALKHRKKHEEANYAIQVEKSTSPILEEKRKEYHDHVEGLFKIVIDNLNPLLENDKEYFNALRKSTANKWRLFQHFRTIDVVSQHSTLFAMYSLSVAQLNELEDRKKVVINDVIDLDRKLEEYNFESRDSTNKLDFKALRSAVGIKHNDVMDSIFQGLPEYPFPSSISCRFYVKDEESGGYKLGVAGNWFASSSNKKQLEELRDFIEEQGYKTMTEVSAIHNTAGTVYSVGAYLFNLEFERFSDSLDGDPVLGACISCLNWFNSENAKKYELVLDEFNHYHSNYEESAWRPEKNN